MDTVEPVEPIGTMREHMDRLRGRMFELIEMAGMPEKQEAAFKRAIRHTTYDAQRDLETFLRRNGRHPSRV